MNKEEIENRIIVCEMRANDYREVGNTKTADRYDNEKYKWEKLLDDLNYEREDYRPYKKGYILLQQRNEELQQENKQLKDNWNELKDYIKDRRICTIYDDFCRQILDKMHELERGEINE